MTKSKNQMNLQNPNPNNAFENLDLNDSFGFWALDFGFIDKRKSC